MTVIAAVRLSVSIRSPRSAVRTTLVSVLAELIAAAELGPLNPVDTPLSVLCLCASFSLRMKWLASATSAEMSAATYPPTGRTSITAVVEMAIVIGHEGSKELN
jgi:hypothetical protein